MRNVGGPVQGQQRPYVPEVPGDPIRVWLRNPTEADKRLIFAGGRASVVLADGEAKLDEGGNPIVTVELGDGSGWKKRALDLCVVGVEEYTRPGENGTAVPIATGADLWLYGEPVIVEDVAAEIVSAYSLSEEKKSASASSSGSTPPETPPSPGTAPSAGETSFAAPEDATTRAQPPASST